MYETGTSIAVRAFHVMPGMEGPEGVLHDHDYRLDVVARRAELDERGMVVDLDVLDAALRGVAAKVDGVDLEVIRPPDADAVTVEVFARWVHDSLSARLAGWSGDELAVRVWESATAFGGYRAPVPSGPAGPASSSS